MMLRLLKWGTVAVWILTALYAVSALIWGWEDHGLSTWGVVQRYLLGLGTVGGVAWLMRRRGLEYRAGYRAGYGAGYDDGRRDTE